MKKGQSIVLAIVLGFSLSAAQVPNGDFESWTGADPTGWATSNVAGFATNVTASTDAHGGTYAMRMEVVTAPGVGAWHPVAQSGPGGNGFSMSARYATVSGWYKFSPMGGDRLGLNFAFTKGGTSGTIVAQGAQAISATVSAYTKFSITMAYVSALIPDTCYLQFQVIGPNSTDYHVGSFALIDDLTMEGSAPTSVADRPSVATSFSLEQNYPNPFNPSTNIGFHLTESGLVRLEVFDILGNKVSTLMNSVQGPGEYSVRFDGGGLSSGVYIARLESGRNVAYQKMILAK